MHRAEGRGADGLIRNMEEKEKQALDEVLARYLDGEPDAEDGPVLGESLRKDPNVGREVTGLLMVDQLLRHHAEPHVDAFLDGLQTRLAAEQEGAAFVDRLESAARSRAPRGRALPWVVAAAACLVAVISWVRSPEEPTPSAQEVPPGVLALLVDEAGARYREGRGPDHVRFSSGPYELLEGTVHLRLVNGIDLVVPAPARFEITSPLRLSLQAGRFRVIVPEQGRGFTVTTPSAAFEDFGTEFGIGVNGDTGESELHVFQGRVDVREPGGEAKLASVVPGESIKVADGEVRPADPPGPEAFPTPDSIGYFRWRTAQERLRRDADLVFYYPFIRDEGDPALLRDHAREGTAVHGRILGARWVTGRWTGKQALLFDRVGDAVALDIPGEFDAFTLACWLKVDRLDYELNAVFDSDGWERGDVHWQLNRHGQLLFGPFTGAKKVRAPEAKIPLGVWTHVAVALDRHAGRAVSYINGREDGVYRLEPVGSYAPGSSRMGDWLRRPDYRHILKRTFAGRIDEMAFWRRALEPEEIRRLVEEGRPAVLWGLSTGSETKR